MSKHLIAYLIIFLVFFYGCEKTERVKGEVSGSLSIYCDMEILDGQDLLGQEGNYRFSNGKARTSEASRSGEYSIALDKNDPFGLGSMIYELKESEKIELSVWIKGKGYICTSGGENNQYYRQENAAVNEDENAWVQVRLNFDVREEMAGDSLKVYVWNPDEQKAYFDDFRILRSWGKNETPYLMENSLFIYLNDKSFQKIRSKRDAALSMGILITEDDDWVKGILFSEEDVLNGRFRLKGDRLDHLRKDKWSYRIKIKGENAWKGMKTFSIQTPAARNFLHEWFFHKALEKEDLLCTRYGFVPINFNGNDAGLYAWEEHFEKQLLESRGRREGPILKITDDSYWIMDMLRAKNDLDFSIPFYDAGKIIPFSKKGILKDSIKRNEFLMGRDLYHQYKYALSNVNDIFDVELMAKYYAIIDASNAYHTLHFFNQRFYFNPVTGKLEPIFYDSFADANIYDYYGSDLLIEEAKTKWIDIHLKLFADKSFKELYFKYLEIYTRESYWQEIYAEHEFELNSLENKIRKEFPDYDFNINVAYEIAEKARSKMVEMRRLDQQEDLFSKYEDRQMSVRKDYVGKAEFALLEHLVVAYREDDQRYRIENYSTDSITITGFSNNYEFERYPLEKEVILSPANSGKEYALEIHTSRGDQNYVFFEIRGQKINVPILPWGSPDIGNIHREQRLDSYLQELITGGILKTDGTSLIFEGDIIIDQDLIIPSNWNLIFKQTCHLDLIEGATFISYGPVKIQGSEEVKVVISSSDKSGRGFNVISAEERSKIEHCIFRDLAHLDFGGWHTTGAISFYESDVDMDQVQFISNVKGDDLLNIIRSDYSISNCHFENANADAFDSDFCTGLIVNTSFVKPGNDAIDFSGSKVKLQNCEIIQAGDKGISCGEASEIEVFDSKIDGAFIGLASKDRSYARIVNSEISNVSYGLVSFCKKPEYGPAEIHGEKLMVKSNLMLHLIERGSFLNFNNREIFGQEKDLAKKFY